MVADVLNFILYRRPDNPLAFNCDVGASSVSISLLVAKNETSP